MTQSSNPLTETDLAYFTGTGNYYQHSLGMRYTDGVKYLADRAGAYWLLDAIASWQSHPLVKDDQELRNIQFWKLVVNEDQSASLFCERDKDDVVVGQTIPMTDFPLKQITLYVQQGTILLPSEY